MTPVPGLELRLRILLEGRAFRLHGDERLEPVAAVDVQALPCRHKAVGRVTLAFGPNGKWPAAAKAVVTGGTLKLENKEVFGKETDMELAASGATVALDYNGVMYMRNLTVGGDIKAAGTYGAPGNSFVPAANRLSCFTGTGRIVFLGNGIGTQMIFR